MRKIDLIIWDEALMMHKHCFEAFDRTLRDKVHPSLSSTPFGGKVVFGGDFRQILPVIPKGRREDIVNASLNSSYLWKDVTVLRLTVNMRFQSDSSIEHIEQTKKFAKWILDIGDGVLGGPNDGEAEVEFSKDVLIGTNGDHILSITNSIYPSIEQHLYDDNYFQDRAILVATNEEVDRINDYMLSKIDNDCNTYLSSDTVCEGKLSDAFEESLYSPEVLNSLKISGFPHHKLTLKTGVPVMLLRNIDQSNGLCNGTRLQVVRLGDRVIEAKVISGKNVGSITYIPKMKMIPSDPRLPVKFQRRQFPLMVCFAMTINKSQGQSVCNVGLFLRRPIFTHGQLYVVVSCVTNINGLKVLICDDTGNTTNKTSNVVYKEVLQKI